MGTTKTSNKRVAALVGIVLGIGAVSILGWNWLDGLVVRQVTVSGNRHADGPAILDVARVDTGGRLLDVNPTVIADRAERHPWVRAAQVRRLPPGIVRIDVEERSPVVLALSRDGRPAAFLDCDGYAMPLAEGIVYDVPLLRGIRLPTNRTQPVESAPLRELLAALADLDPSVDALLSSFEVRPDGDVTLHTTPAGSQASIDVRLGKRGFGEKFERLSAFWTQAVLSRPDKTFETIDLRFDGHIVTHES